MSQPSQGQPKGAPVIVATGFSSSLLGDERTLREFVVGDHIASQMAREGSLTLLYLVNDTYDALSYAQLRVGVNKDPELLQEFAGFCGQPIAEIPDPLGCHESYAEHFAQALMKRLCALGIHPVLIDAHSAYRRGLYAEAVARTFENYHEIQTRLSERFSHYTMQNLFRAQCPKCRCIDSTHIREVSGGIVRFECERCGTITTCPTGEVVGKLAWKLDCAARWNIYGIDIETFSKDHVGRLGTFEISRFVSEEYFGGKVPKVVRYGHIQLDRELSYRLLEILPPAVFKKLLTTRLGRDLHISRDFVESFCKTHPVRGRMSYLDYVRKVLPRDALHEDHVKERYAAPPGVHGMTESLVGYGNRFSKFFYGREYRVRFPDPDTILAADPETAAAAREVIHHAISIRRGSPVERKNAQGLLKTWLFSRESSPAVYQFIRRVLRQTEGPNITTLLTILPLEYLEAVHLALGSVGGNGRPVPSRTVKAASGGSDSRVRPDPDLSLTGGDS